MRAGALIPGIGAATLAVGLLLVSAGEPQSAEMAAPVAVPALRVDGEPATGPYAPLDECRMLPGFDAFRSGLFAAVENRDVDALVGLAHPAIKLDLGGGAGIDEFRRRLETDESLWGELDELQHLGCASDNREDAVLPWIATRAGGDTDPALTYWVTGSGVAMLAAPDAAATRVGSVDFDLVKTTGDEEPVDGFRQVATRDGTAKGYVAEDKLRSIADYRLAMTRGPNGWMIDMFIAGD
ncbi:hypothetical protein [Croceicoccus bisphenolivorans]|uniref:hypothetical protein n=1 Tax=Croceicoccus bisphenolivorans TaxID=1783232 RepID=UPI00083698EB|nr:hypothetical protein [Croceicoccus bisphenolivorans]